jgi:mono/diheme cytochrome c family protein
MKAGVAFLAFAMAGVPLAFTPSIGAAQPGDSALFEQGRQLYDANCVACHQAGGGGSPPAMPALTGNDRLSDAEQVVRTIRLGRGAMPAFPKLSADELAALTTYVRNAWSNKFGAVATAQVDTILAGIAKPTDAKKRSIWSGVYTTAQSTRGAEFYENACSHCHGERLNGAAAPDQPPSPAIARAGFLRKWAGQSVAALFVYVRTKMPPDNPGAYNDQDNIDAVAHMFAVSNIPAGDKELPPDPKALADIVIEVQPK